GIVPDHDPALRAAERLARRTRQDGGALREGILELTTGDEAQLMRAVEEDPSAPLRDDLAHLPDGELKQCHRCSKGDDLRLMLAGHGRERLEVDLQFLRIDGNVDDPANTDPRRPVD